MLAQHAHTQSCGRSEALRGIGDHVRSATPLEKRHQQFWYTHEKQSFCRNRTLHNGKVLDESHAPPRPPRLSGLPSFGNRQLFVLSHIIANIPTKTALLCADVLTAASIDDGVFYKYA